MWWWRRWLAVGAAGFVVGCAPHALDSVGTDAGVGSVPPNYATASGDAAGDGARAADAVPPYSAGTRADAAAPADARADAATPDASAGAGPVNPGVCVPPSSASLRLLAPVSGSTVTSASPRLRWAGGGGLMEIQICFDRACQRRQIVFSGQGSEATSPIRLQPGYWFWRARPDGKDDNSWTRTWLFRVRRRAPGYAPLANTAAEAFSDYNGDGYPDFAINAGTTTYIYLGGADGIAADRVLRVDGPQPYGGLSVYREPNADVNGDGFTDFGWKRDIAVPGQSWPMRIALIEFGSRTGFSPDSAIVDVLTEPYPLWVGEPAGLGDFDGDGYGDMIVTMRYGGALLRGCAPAPAVGPWGFFSCGDCQGQQVATGDFDGDGRSDVVFADAGDILVYPGNVIGLRPIGYPGSSGYTVIDFNYDGYSDLLVRRGYPTAVIEAHEGGAGGLSPALSTAPQPPATFGLAGDFDGDGYWDTIVPHCADCRPPTSSVVYGVAEGWGAPSGRTTELDASLVGATAAVVDLNADGYDDLLVEGPGAGVTSFFAGSPDGLAATATTAVMR